MPCKHPMHDTDCPFDCVNPDPRCEYCGESAVDEIKRRGRVELACEQCLIAVQAGDEMDRREEAYERAVDQALSEWKDEGKVGWPRQVRRRW